MLELRQILFGDTPVPMALPVPEVRLVIWDLDGVGWHGTLAEDGISPRPEWPVILATLVGRGIMNSICSKNDLEAARATLQGQGVWEHFIFPSIDWTPKGARLAALVEAVQLRPETILFIDDEPANLAEARFHVPGLQTAGPEIVAGLLDDPRLAGKPDPAHARLAQYRQLMARQQAFSATKDGHLAFLRASHVRVSIEHDVEPHLDRAIELINRTNQLNFTKSRLPEDLEAARAQLRATLVRADVFAGLVRVIDDYGDYGFAGFYCGKMFFGQRTLTQFCFSCRVLNLGVEAFIYRHIASPALKIVGEVAGDPFRATEIDWITLDASSSFTPARGPKLVDRLVLRGGCEMQALAHYLRPLADEVSEELAAARGNRAFRIEHSMFLDHALSPPEGEIRAALEALGHEAADWRSALSDPRPGKREAWVFSLWVDDFMQLYKHKTLPLTLPFAAQGDARATQDLTRFSPEAMRDIMTEPAHYEAWETLRRDYWCVGPLFEYLLEPVIHRLMAAARRQGAVVVFLLAPSRWRHRADEPAHPRPSAARMNGWLQAMAPDAHFVDPWEFAPPDAVYPDILHFDRLVYCHAAAHIAELIETQLSPV
ncbi:hypothetical protein [Acidocella sp. MX-AZ02]|uniref:hypothetical protein n=2 Tax=unclassified Acidocella TaxID=2648610 RepID=UPI00028D3247|nr:hypothetical protein [Acidocella sp. MX-AZ02]EKN00427.1 hypothetical protein MXAZACID_05381 [Acidocella sp. MX-AZ02]